VRFFKSISKNDLLKIASLNGLSVVLKIAIGLITSKVLAVFVGPSGLALVGNFKNFVASVETIATLGFQNGIVKYVVESEYEQSKLKKTLSTLFFSITIVAIGLSIILFFLADFWSATVFGVGFRYSLAFKAFAIALPWYANALLIISIINGLGKSKKVIAITIIGNLIGLFVSILLVINFQTLGALLGIITTPSLLFFVAIYFLNKDLKLFEYLKWKDFDFLILKNLTAFSFMALFSAVVGPLVYLKIRTFAILKVGAEQAGFWVTMDMIANYYLLFVGTILTIYFLPKLVKANTKIDTKSVLWDYFKSIVPIFVLGLILIYFLRFFIIKLLFTKAFLPVSELFIWQLSGDIFRAIALILGYNLVAKKLTFQFIGFEILSLSTMYVLSKMLLPIYGIEGILMAHCGTYFTYMIALIIYFRKSIF
jgi:PST family polysaccharide transporter